MFKKILSTLFVIAALVVVISPARASMTPFRYQPSGEGWRCDMDSLTGGDIKYQCSRTVTSPKTCFETVVTQPSMECDANASRSADFSVGCQFQEERVEEVPYDCSSSTQETSCVVVVVQDTGMDNGSSSYDPVSCDQYTPRNSGGGDGGGTGDYYGGADPNGGW